MTISNYRSIVVLPNRDTPYPSILDFFTLRFPAISREVWEARISSGKVLTEEGEAISEDMPYLPLKRLIYFREVEKESIIPFSEKILFQDEELLVACKPHFLPVTPGGPYVNECLLHRLKKRTRNQDLSPINRIDRETAGIVLFSKSPSTRGQYQELFMRGAVEKTYEAVAEFPNDPGKESWIVENRLIKGEPWFRMKPAPGIPNAVSHISFVGSEGERGFFRLQPLTGKKHQLRLHMSGLGFPILNDRYYPTLLPEKREDFTAPLQLLARRIRFRDPLSGRELSYETDRQLSSWPKH